MEINEIKAVHEYILAVNFLVDRLEYMMEEGELHLDILQKRIDVVNKFKGNLEDKLK